MQQPQSPELKIVIPTYRWHTQMFDNMFNNINEADALKRIEDRTNNVVWTLGNLVNCRYWLANLLGLNLKDPNDDLFREGKAYDASSTYPSLKDFRDNWHLVSKKLYEKLLTVSDEELKEAYDFGMEVSFVENNKLNMVGMAMDRCSYLLGQLALLRRAIANVGTSYDINSDINY